jgi:hypothetical protein
MARQVTGDAEPLVVEQIVHPENDDRDVPEARMVFQGKDQIETLAIGEIVLGQNNGGDYIGSGLNRALDGGPRHYQYIGWRLDLLEQLRQVFDHRQDVTS